MPTLVVTGQPIVPGAIANVEGTSFTNRPTRLLLDGVIVTKEFRPERGGSFQLGVKIVNTSPTQTLAAQQRSGSSWSEVARTNVQVRDAVDPPPVPEPDRRFPAPVVSRTVMTPESWDRTGSQGISGQLAAFLAQVPNGSEIIFRPGSYLLTSGLLLERRSNLILRGKDARLTVAGPDSEAMSPILLRASDHISVFDFTLVGGYNAYPGQQGEKSHAVGLSGWYGGVPSTYVEIGGVKGSNNYGDGVYIEGQNVGSQLPAHHVWIHDSSFSTVGRNALSLINCTDVWFERNKTDKIAYHAVDIEPNFKVEQVRRLYIDDNDFGVYADRSGLIGYWIAAWSPEASPISDIYARRNKVQGTPANGYDKARGAGNVPLGLFVKFPGVAGNGATVRAKNIVIEDNEAFNQQGWNPTMQFVNCDGVTARRNIQPGKTASNIATFTNCTGVVTS